MIDKIIPSSLLSKLILAGSSVQILMLGLVLWHTVYTYENEIEEYVRVETQIIAPLLNAALSQYVFQRDYAGTRAVLASLDDSKLRFLEVYDGGGQPFASFGYRTPADAAMPQPLADNESEVRHRLVLGDETVGEVRFALKTTSLAGWHSALMQRNIALVTCAMLLSALIMALMGYGLIKRIKTLMGHTQMIGAGNYSMAIDGAGRDELHLLAAEFDLMRVTLKQRSEALQFSEQRLRDFATAGSDWFWELDAQLRITWLSENFERFSDARREDVYGKFAGHSDTGDNFAFPGYQKYLEALQTHNAF